MVQNNTSGSTPTHGKKKSHTKNTTQQPNTVKSLLVKNKLE